MPVRPTGPPRFSLTSAPARPTTTQENPASFTKRSCFPKGLRPGQPIASSSGPAVELTEKRKDAQVARELLLSLPHQLTHEQRVELVQRFVREVYVAQGMIADIAIHLPHRDGDHRNHHAHVMLTMRGIAGEGFGGKVREWNDRALLANWREQWAAYQNVLFEELGLPLRADHRSLDDRGIDREPEPKLGPEASAMERKGKDSILAEWRKAVRDRNAERQQLEHEKKIIDLELKRKEKEAKAKHRPLRRWIKPAAPSGSSKRSTKGTR